MPQAWVTALSSQEHNNRAARFMQALIDYTVELGMNSVEPPEVEIDPDDFSKCQSLSPYKAVKKVEGTGPSATRLRSAALGQAPPHPKLHVCVVGTARHLGGCLRLEGPLQQVQRSGCGFELTRAAG
eukprot:3766685-Rhodomonas_salina.1